MISLDFYSLSGQDCEATFVLLCFLKKIRTAGQAMKNVVLMSSSVHTDWKMKGLLYTFNNYPYKSGLVVYTSLLKRFSPENIEIRKSGHPGWVVEIITCVSALMMT